LLLFGTVKTTDVTALSIVLAACVSVYFNCQSALLVRRASGENQLSRTIYWVFVLSVLLGGGQVQFLKASVYQEVICWAAAIASAFAYCSLRGLFSQYGFSTLLLCSLATLSGLALHTRVPEGLGLYVGMSLLLLSTAAREGPIASRRRKQQSNETSRTVLIAAVSRRVLLPAVILLVFALLCGIVNYERWGSPFRFSAFNNLLTVGERGAVIERSGIFNPIRLFYSILYYFVPVTFIEKDGSLLFDYFRRNYYDLTELPPSSFLLSDPLLLLFGSNFAARFVSNSKSLKVDRIGISSVLLAFSIPVFLILHIQLSHVSVSWRLLPAAGFRGAYGILRCEPRVRANSTGIESPARADDSNHRCSRNRSRSHSTAPV
jgi:hypothetical protein